MVLSSQNSVYKTQRFLGLTRHFSKIDLFLSKIADNILSKKMLGDLNTKQSSFFVSINNDKIYFVVKDNDIIFISYEGHDAFIRKGDARFFDLSKKDDLEIYISNTASTLVPDTDLKKLYRLTDSNFVHFPLLDSVQESIITTENENMLVQGVAGSGKTNLCIDKIVYSASRGYAGRILYSTFSRGLLADTRLKVNEFNKQIKILLSAFESNSITIIGDSLTRAIENKLGLRLKVAPDKVIDKLKQIINYLDTSVDYLLIEDIARQNYGEITIADENYFSTKYIKSIKNHQLTSRLQKLSHLSNEVIYKEIFGLILGGSKQESPKALITLTDYIALRKDSFNANDCETIYTIAKDYLLHLKNNNLSDNNTLSRKMLNLEKAAGEYSLIVLDEVQDFTQINLQFFKSITLKMFCVGDALQMINASYFSFSYLKRILYQKDLSSTAELISNYRNSKLIADIAVNLSDLNAKWFGVHRFLLKNKPLDTYAKSEAAFVSDKNFVSALANEKSSSYTVVVATNKEKLVLREKLPKAEVLTVSDIKGLERDNIVLYNLTSINQDKFAAFSRANISRKTADENSVYRYYFNLLYVGISRARQKLYVFEENKVDIFKDFYSTNFKVLDSLTAAKNLQVSSDKLESEQDELIDRVEEFIKLGQYDNARFTANKIVLERDKKEQLAKIEVFEHYISKGRHKDAGIKFLQYGLYSSAKEQFDTVNETVLSNLAASCEGSDNELGLEVINSYIELQDNEEVRKIIVGLVQSDLQKMHDNNRNTSITFKKIKEKSR